MSTDSKLRLLLLKHVSAWQGRRILVVGDAMLDVTTKVTRRGWSAEHQDREVPVHSIVDRTYSLGGAANAAANLASLGANATLVCAVGRDTGAEWMERLAYRVPRLRARLVKCPHQRTTTKDRIGGYDGELLRLDSDDWPLYPMNEMLLANEVCAQLDEAYEGLLLSDYNKGVLNSTYVRRALAGHSIPHAVLDPKASLLGCEVPVDAATPNWVEGVKLGGKDRQRFFEIPEMSAVVETNGAGGATHYWRGGFHVPTPTEPVMRPHVCGAGDTFAAALLLSMVVGASWLEGITLANAAARVAVQNPGTHHVTEDELRRELNA